MNVPPSLGIGNSSSDPFSYFGLPAPTDPIMILNSTPPLTIPVFGSSINRSTGPSLLPQPNSNSRFTLGVDLNLNRNRISPPVPLPKPISFSEFMQSGQANPDETIGDLSLSATSLVAPPIGLLQTTADLGKTAYESSKAIIESDKSKTEAAGCELAKVVGQKVTSTVGDILLLGGIPLLIASAPECPPCALAATVIAAKNLPQAYANKEKMASFAGDKMKEKCHQLFSGN
jgi:hypothetical protein